MLTTRTTATVIGVLFLAADAAGAAGRLMGGRLVSAPVDVAALQAHGNRVVGAALLTLLMGVLLALIPVVGFPVFRRHDEVLATGYLVFRGALEMIGYAATAFVWLAMASVPAGPGASGVINTLAKDALQYQPPCAPAAEAEPDVLSATPKVPGGEPEALSPGIPALGAEPPGALGPGRHRDRQFAAHRRTPGK